MRPVSESQSLARGGVASRRERETEGGRERRGRQTKAVCRRQQRGDESKPPGGSGCAVRPAPARAEAAGCPKQARPAPPRAPRAAASLPRSTYLPLFGPREVGTGRADLKIPPPRGDSVQEWGGGGRVKKEEDV